MARSLKYIEHHFDGSFELWRQHIGAMFDVAPILSTDESTQFQTHVYVHHCGAIERARYGDVLFDHTGHHAEAARGLISVARYPRGGPVEQHVRLAPAMRPRTLFLFDHAVSYKTFHFAAELENMYILKTALGLAETDHVPARRFLPGTPLAVLLNAEMDRVFAALDDKSPPVFPERAVLRFMACVRMAVRGRTLSGLDESLVRDAVFDQIRDYIRANLSDARLGSAHIVGQFGVSRPTLYRMFQPYGGVHAYIAHHRMFRAAYDLAARRTRRGEIKRISERWGLSSGLQLNRAIRNVFGTAPTELFGAPLEPPDTIRHFDYLKGYLDPLT